MLSSVIKRASSAVCSHQYRDAFSEHVKTRTVYVVMSCVGCIRRGFVIVDVQTTTSFYAVSAVSISVDMLVRENLRNIDRRDV